MLWLLMHMILLMHYGERNLYDADQYVACADHLLSNGQLISEEYYFYALPVVMMAFFRAIFPGEIIPFLIFQIIVSGFAVVALYQSGTRLFNNRSAGLSAGIAFLLWWDNLHWNTTAMTESIACSLIIFILHTLIHFQQRKRDVMKLLLFCVALLFTRPTGVVILVATMIFLVIYYYIKLSGCNLYWSLGW